MDHTDALMGVQIRGYDVIEELAHGNYGVVFRGVQKRLNRFVAIKILSESLAKDIKYVNKFHHEAEVAALLTHPNVVQAYDVGQAESGEYFFAMEMVEGEDISKIMAREGRIKWRQALYWMSFVADALNYGMKKNKVTHGDIKPANVMIKKNGQVKLADLGLACMGGEEKSNDIMLTPYYAAPEVITGRWQVGDPRADMYSFGASIYHMLTGHPVFESENFQKILQMHLESKVIDPSVYASIPHQVSDFLLKLLSKNPDDRFSDWCEIYSEIHRLLTSDIQNDTGRVSQTNRKRHVDFERRQLALKKLKARKRKKSRALKNYGLGVSVIAILYFVSDVVLQSVGGEGAWKVLQAFVQNLSGG